MDRLLSSKAGRFFAHHSRFLLVPAAMADNFAA